MFPIKQDTLELNSSSQFVNLDSLSNYHKVQFVCFFPALHCSISFSAIDIQYFVSCTLHHIQSLIYPILLYMSVH